MIKQIAFLLFAIIVLPSNNYAQEDKVYTSLEEALAAHPDSVMRLDLSKAHLKTIPSEILAFQNLKELDLSKNQLTELPDNFYFPKLEVLHLTKNKFSTFPEAITKNTSITQLYLGKNKLSSLPESIGQMVNLVILDVWFNTISDIPESTTQLKKLRSLDLRGMNYSNEFQAKWKKALPWVTIEFDVGCDCGY